MFTKEGIDSAATTLSTVLSLLAILGIFYKFVIKPNLEDIVEKFLEMHTQTTVNKHVSETPTLLDKVDTVGTKVNSIEESVSHINDRLSEVETDVSKLKKKRRWFE